MGEMGMGEMGGNGDSNQLPSFRAASSGYRKLGNWFPVIPRHELARQVFVEEQFHKAARLPSLAANW
jgi:hypothetical protein